MLVAETNAHLQSEIRHRKSAIVGFIPTMGALHHGHISLLEKAHRECDMTVVSIFVNPTQFNNPEDLKLYPRTLERDLKMLEECGCHLVFVPSAEEIYPEPKKDNWHFGLLSSTLEGFFRPGHFDGVLTVVKRLFEIVEPDKAYFGEKDFQQLSLIRKMAEVEKLPVEIVPCPIIREADGLAMSSRNTRLSAEERSIASHISRILFKVKEEKAAHHAPEELKQVAQNEFDNVEGLRLEYFDIVDAETFVPLTGWKQSAQPIALTAAYVGEVRLIDNIRL